MRPTPVWTRDAEASLVGAAVDAVDAVAQHRAPDSAREADGYRFSAQLLRTRYRRAHGNAGYLRMNLPDVLKIAERLAGEAPAENAAGTDR